MMPEIPLLHYVVNSEHILIVSVLAIMFILGLKKSTETPAGESFVLDKNFSGALKGIAVILILMTHYEQMFVNETSGLVRTLVARIPANVALVWFMFISGFGCTKTIGNKKGYLSPCVTRCSKVFLPMFFCFTVSILLYIILPYRFNLDATQILHLPKEIYLFHNHATDVPFVLKGLFRSYWYVWCILMYYVIFYASSYLANKFKISKTNILLLLMVAYYIAAFNIAGESYAHYYRLTWAFFLGHVFASMHEMSKKKIVFYVMMSALPSVLFEARYMNFSFFLAVLTLLIVSFLNKRYAFNSKPLLYLGSISFFFYLIHRRIAWVICCYLGFSNVILWVLVSLFVSVLMWQSYNALKLKKHK